MCSAAGDPSDAMLTSLLSGLGLAVLVVAAGKNTTALKARHNCTDSKAERPEDWACNEEPANSVTEPLPPKAPSRVCSAI